MSPEIQPYVLPLLMAVIGMLGLTLPAWRTRREPVVALFIAMCIITSAWPLAVGLELLTPSMAWKLPLAQVRPLLITISVSVFALLIIQFTGSLVAYRRQVHWVLAAGVTGVAALTVSPPELKWFHHGFELSPRAPHRLHWESGSLEMAYIGWVAGLTFASLGLLVTSVKGRGFAFRRSVYIILAGTMMPLVLNTMSKLKLTDWAGMNLAPLGMLAPAAAWAIALYRYGMLNLVPLGRATVLETMPDLVFILDRRGMLVDCNRSALAALGSTAPLSEPWATALRDTGIAQFQHSGRTYRVTRTPVLDASHGEAGAVVTLHDVTDWMQARERLQTSHRLEIVGKLAGGMAHEYNNLLTVILGYTALILDTTPPEDPKRQLVTHIDEAGQKAAKLTSQLLSFSRRQMLQPSRLRLNDVVEGTENLMRQLLGPAVQLTLTLDPAPGLVKVDRHQMEMLLVELVINARDAMPYGGKVEIALERRDGDLLLAIRDNGEGMAEATREQIFEPFFTTRGSAVHAGLGLSMAHGFVAQSGGRIEVNSRLGQGTDVLIFLPACG